MDENNGVNFTQKAKDDGEQGIQMLIGVHIDTNIMPPPAIRVSTYMQAPGKHSKNAGAAGSKSSKTPGVDR